MVSTISSSPTVTSSSTVSRTIGNVSSPGRFTAMPSAIVSTRVTGSITPQPHARTIGSQPAAWTPTIRTDGCSARSAIATPDSSPPPPHGTTTTSRPGTCSASSSPIVPWPAITSSSSNADTNVAPVRVARSRAATAASSYVSPPSWMPAP